MTDTRVRLLVDGVAFPNWTSYEVSTDMRRAAGSWTVRAPTRRDKPVTPGGVVALKIGSRQVLRGRVEEVEQVLGSDQDELVLSGRDSGGALLGCAAKPSWRWRGQLLSTIATTVGQFAGVDRGPDVQADSTIKDWKVEPGDSCWTTLRNLVESEGLRLWVAGDGRLRISQWQTYGRASGRLVRKRAEPQRNNILRSRVRRAWREAWSEVQVIGEWDAGEGAGQIVGRWVDLTAPSFRLAVRQERVRSQADADNRAADIGRQAALQRLEIEYEVAGHLNGQAAPWELNELVEVDDEVEELQGDYLLVGRTFTNGDQGQRTRLTLIEPEALTRG